MSRNRLMHPRNTFIVPPDYTGLAIKYPTFRKICKLALNGKVNISLKNEETLRALTSTLLIHYFDLKVEFASNSLIPTLSLRLNYILWIEDIINALGLQEIHGIDIGCGSSCIYALLAAKKNNWVMSALEANSINIQFATDNIRSNNLEKSVHIFAQIRKEIILSDFLESTMGTDYSFCMCNPPFYDVNCTLTKSARNSEKRKEPKNCQTGNKDELFCEGGEFAFVNRIISESEYFPNRVKVFTTMLGHKKNASRVIECLKNKKIENFTTTEFCQGNTTRWGIAWSFDNETDLSKIS